MLLCVVKEKSGDFILFLVRNLLNEGVRAPPAYHERKMYPRGYKINMASPVMTGTGLTIERGCIVAFVLHAKGYTNCIYL